MFVYLAASGSDHTDAIYALVGAIGAALVISLVNHFVLRRQLNAEAERLDQQLRHDRELVDLGELRGLLDRGAQLIWQTIDKITDTWVAADDWATASIDARAQDDEGSAEMFVHYLQQSDKALAEVMEKRGAAYKVVWSFDDILGQLAIRLGRQDPVADALAKFRDEVKTELGEVPGAPPDTLDEMKQRRTAHFEAVREAQTRYVDLAQALVGSQVRRRS